MYRQQEIKLDIDVSWIQFSVPLTVLSCSKILCRVFLLILVSILTITTKNFDQRLFEKSKLSNFN